MKHLTSVEFVDLLEGTLEAPRAGHATSCEQCRRQAEQLRDALAQTRDVDAPEPSPLFWDHLSARVREAVAARPVPRPAWAFMWHPAWGFALATAIALLVVTIWWPTRIVPAPSAPAPGAGEVTASDWLAPLGATPDDEAWTLVTSLADRVTWDEADSAGFAPSANTLAGEVFRLSAEERSELARLIRAELPRSQS